MAFQALRGMSDLLPNDVKRWSTVEHAASRLASLFGYQHIRTPIIEDAALFLRSVGETSDIVQKQMFHFEDRGGQAIALRPEGTAAIVRAYLQHNLHKTEGFAKLFYLGPMFRAERPQAGRTRQFHQFGAEAIGSSSPWVDVEIITLCVESLRACGVKKMSIWISSMGSRQDQERSGAALRKRLKPQLKSLCKTCQQRFEKNVFRILDCKNPSCHALAWETTEEQEASGHHKSQFLLSQESQERFAQVQEGLHAAGIAFDNTHSFARGLDYYTHTVFEVRAEGLGAQDAVAAGGRYDHLVEQFGGPSVGACGFAAGIERILMAAKHQGEAREEPPRRGVFLAVANLKVMPDAFKLARDLRSTGLRAVIALEGRSLKAQLREANKRGSRWVAILGPKELAQGQVMLKDLEAGKQEPSSLNGLAKTLAAKAKIGKHCF